MDTTPIYNTTMLHNSGKDAPNITLQELNDQYAQTRIGGMVFVGILMIVGVVGNAHVIYLYAFRFPKSNHRIYILWLAVLDMITCSVGMPFVLIDLRNPLMFDNVAVCKILRFVNYFNSSASALILVVISVDRFKRICRPFKTQMTEQRAIIAGIIVVVIAVFFAWPAPVLYGRSSVETNYTGITGVACFTEDRFKNTQYQAYYNEILIISVLICVIILITLYSIIGRTIWKQAKSRSGPTFSDSSTKSNIVLDTQESTESTNANTTQSSGLSSDSSNDSAQPKQSGRVDKTSTEEVKTNDTVTKVANRKSKMKTNDARKSQSKRITLMLFIITVVYILAFIPHLSLKITVFLKKGFLENLSPAGLFLYHTFVWTFFINNMANPIIYGFCDQRFRKKIKVMYKSCFPKQYKAEIV